MANHKAIPSSYCDIINHLIFNFLFANYKLKLVHQYCNPPSRRLHVCVLSVLLISFPLALLNGSSLVDSLRNRYVISAKPCRNAIGQTGTCMFMWDCIKSEGLHLGTCSDGFLFGSCCYHNSTFNDVDIQRPNTSSPHVVSDSKSQVTVDPMSATSPTTTASTLTMTTSQQATLPMPSIEYSQPTTVSLIQSASAPSKPPSPSTTSHQSHLSLIIGQTKTHPTAPNSDPNIVNSLYSNNSNNNATSVIKKANASTTNVDTNNSTQDIRHPGWQIHQYHQAPDNSTNTQTSSWHSDEIGAQTTTKQSLYSQKPAAAQVTATTTTIAPLLHPNSLVQTANLQHQQGQNSDDAVHQQRPLLNPIGLHQSTPSRPTTAVNNLFQPHGSLQQSQSPPSQPIAHQQQQQNDQMSSGPQGQLPQRPHGWLSRPSLIANAIFHSFKPFTYLSPSRHRPTHRPYQNTVGNIRPLHYRPVLAQQHQQQQHQTQININPSQQLQQQPQLTAQESISETYETKLSNQVNRPLAATMLAPIHTNNKTQINTLPNYNDNSDHHVVNPNSSISMTDRQRPIDKNQSNGTSLSDMIGTDHKVQQHHYELLNNSTLFPYGIYSNNGDNTTTYDNSSTPAYSQYQSQYTGPSNTVQIDSLDQQTQTSTPSSIKQNTTFPANTVTSTLQASIIALNPLLQSNSYGSNSDSLTHAMAGDGYGQGKPVLSFGHSTNESINYPTYPLIASHTNLEPQQASQPPTSTATATAAGATSDGGIFSTMSPLDEIPGLSENNQFLAPSKENASTIGSSLTPLVTHVASENLDIYTDRPGGLTSNAPASSNNNNNDHHNHQEQQQIHRPGQIVESTTFAQQQDASTSQAGIVLIGNLDDPTTTIAGVPNSTMSATSLNVMRDPSQSKPTLSTASTTTMLPTTSFLPPNKISLASSSLGDGTKKGTLVAGTVNSGDTSSSNREVACGVTSLYPQTKVVGGKNAAFGAWPWQVSVRKVSFFGFSSTHRCGGAVISSEWIATAGHCVEDLALQSIRIRVGEYDFSSMAEPYQYIERAARRKVVHPKYNFYTYENDLALVQLDQPLQFPPHVAPICLPPDNIDLLGRNATVTGWGRLNEGGTLPTVLQEVRVPIVSNDKCKDMFLNAGRPEYIPDIFLCAGYEEGGRDSCQGDSGGPLQVRGDDGKWFLAGIISWGIGCAEQNLPGVCTRISRFKLWIQSTMSSS